MCGIAAIFAYHADAPNVDEGELTAIRDHMIARGPDGSGNWLDPQRRIGLAHRRLSIIDLSPGGAQPMLWPEKKLAVVFNGEIYNYRELRSQLQKRGHVFHSNSDTEVLLHLYAEQGEAMVHQLRGMFAFAIWDGTKRGLFLARDTFGIKPLYIADNGKTLRAASQVKALLAGGKITTTPAPAGHVGFFLWGHVPEPFTLHQQIRSLPAGSTLWIGSDGSRREKTFCTVTEILWRAEKPLTRSSDTLSPSDGERDGVRGALRDSISHHLIADVPVGVFLSSGLDSTTLAALAAEQGGTLRTVTLGFEEFRGTANDETPLAESVARQYHAQHQTIWVTRQDFENETERLFAAMDQPSIDGVNTYFVSLAAKRAGLKVAISGLGGDELFGGYPSFTEIPRAVSACQLFSYSAFQPLARGIRTLSSPLLRRVTSPKYAGLFEYGGTYGGAYLLRRGLFMPWELPEFLDRDLVREGLAQLDTLTALNATANLCAPSLSASNGERAGVRCSTPSSPLPSPRSQLPPRLRVSALETCWYMRNQLLRDADWAGMAHSLEIRVPLVDIQLLRSLLPALASTSPPTKRDMALSPDSQLPTSVLLRKKTGFSVPVRDWLTAEKEKVESRKSKCDRGLRGWARKVYDQFADKANCSTKFATSFSLSP